MVSSSSFSWDYGSAEMTAYSWKTVPPTTKDTTGHEQEV